MSVEREGNVVTIAFEDDSWKEGLQDVYSVTDGKTTFSSKNTWLVDDHNVLCSGSIRDGGLSDISITVILMQEGKMNLNYIVSSEGNYDWLTIEVDGNQVLHVSGTSQSAFTEFENPLSAGTHTISIKYTKDGSGARGKDAAAIGYLKITGVLPPFEVRYLLQDFNKKVYSIVDGEVKEIPELEGQPLNEKSLFHEYGFEKRPTSEQIVSLTKPVIFRWSEEKMNSMKGQAVAIPKAQTISAVADLHHKTILGITGITAVYEGNITVSYSYDGKTYTAPVPMEDFLGNDLDALYKGAVNKMIYFRFVIEDQNSSLTNFVISYRNG